MIKSFAVEAVKNMFEEIDDFEGTGLLTEISNIPDRNMIPPESIRKEYNIDFNEWRKMRFSFIRRVTGRYTKISIFDMDSGLIEFIIVIADGSTVTFDNNGNHNYHMFYSFQPHQMDTDIRKIPDIWKEEMIDAYGDNFWPADASYIWLKRLMTYLAICVCHYVHVKLGY